MISYALAKQIMDAGWEQPEPFTIGIKLGPFGPLKGDYVCDGEGNEAYAPGLPELIEACPSGHPYIDKPLDHSGFNLWFFCRQAVWRAGYELVMADAIVGEGSTPEEAVARLWLKLQEGK